MSGIRIAATVVYIIVCLVLVFLVFKGKGSGCGLSGGITGRSNDTYSRPMVRSTQKMLYLRDQQLFWQRSLLYYLL